MLCDISMPVMSGFEVLERLNEIAPKGGRVPFVFLTSMTEREDEMRSRRLGADGYVVKPVAVKLSKVGLSSSSPASCSLINRSYGLSSLNALIT